MNQREYDYERSCLDRRRVDLEHLHARIKNNSYIQALTALVSSCERYYYDPRKPAEFVAVFTCSRDFFMWYDCLTAIPIDLPFVYNARIDNTVEVRLNPVVCLSRFLNGLRAPANNR